MADIFISHSSADNHTADRLKAWLSRDRPSWSVFLDKHPKDGILAGQGWQDRLRSELTSCRLVLAIITPDWLASRWCFTEAVTAEFRGKDFLPVLPKTLSDNAFEAAPPVLNRNQRRVIDLATEAGWPDILRALDRSGLDPDQWFAISDSVGPYPGFVAFEERDAGVFFGRDGEITDYLAALNKLRAPDRAQALAISGGSGTGKSSLLKAGLIPRLRRQDWCIIPPFDPSREPLHAFLASLREAALAAGVGLDLSVGADSIAETLFSAIDEAMRRLEERTKAWLLLPLDQAEALVASGVTEHGEEGRRLLDLVGQLLATRRRALIAIFTIRTEFLPRLETAVPIEVRLEQKPLGGIKALADVIELPAARFGIELEAGLSARMVEETHGAESLPLLAYTLRELNVRFGDDKKLTVAEYEALGGVEGAIEKKLGEALSDPVPDEEELKALRRCFTHHLIRLDEEAVRSLRFLRVAKLKAALPSAAYRLLDRLVEARLIVQRDDGRIAIAHERLIQNWPTAPILDWLEADALDQRLIKALKEQQRQYLAGGGLLSGKLLKEAILLIDRDQSIELEDEHIFNFIRVSINNQKENIEKDRNQTLVRVVQDLSGANLEMHQDFIISLMNSLKVYSDNEFHWEAYEAMRRAYPSNIRCIRAYAQHILEKGLASIAVDVLRNLARRLPKDHPEQIETTRLLGSAFKQMFFDAPDKIAPGARDALKGAIESYRRAYGDNAACAWHGVNLVALLTWARRLGTRVAPDLNPKDVARRVVDTLEETPEDRRDDWFMPTLAEACLGLGDWDEVERNLKSYVADPEAKASLIGSTLRQFDQVWDIGSWDNRGRDLLNILRARLAELPGGDHAYAASELQALRSDPVPDDALLEAVLGEHGPQTFKWWRTGLDRAVSVATIWQKLGNRIGTGFLVRAGDFGLEPADDLLVLTAFHVVNEHGVMPGLKPEDSEIRFEAANRPQRYDVDSIVWSSPPDRHDASFLRLQKFVEDIPALPLATSLPSLEGEGSVYRICCVDGSNPHFSFQKNELLDHEGPPGGKPQIPGVSRVHYLAPTEGGSSGSPVFNAHLWEVIALHHKGGKIGMPRLNGNDGTYAANEGISIQSIRQAML